MWATGSVIALWLLSTLTGFVVMGGAITVLVRRWREPMPGRRVLEVLVGLLVTAGLAAAAALLEPVKQDFSLLDRYLAGDRLDLDAFSGFVPSACHQLTVGGFHDVAHRVAHDQGRHGESIDHDRRGP